MKVGCAALVLAVCCLVPYAAAEHSATQCVISVRAETYPITYRGEPRVNPDGTFYPGDGFYYIFEWRDMSPPDECSGVRPVSLETGAMLLNHTSMYRGPGDDYIVRAGSINHYSYDPAVELVQHVQYHHSKKTGEACRTVCTHQNCQVRFYERVLVYAEPFLVKQRDGLTARERDEAHGSGQTWELWEQTRRPDSWRDIPYCTDVKRVRTAPDHLAYHGDMIYHTTSHTWVITKNGTAHAHDFISYADPDSSESFRERVEEACGALYPESGCVYGIAEIAPNLKGRICIHETLLYRGIDLEEAPPEVPGVYRPPEDDCAPLGGILMEITIEGTYTSRYHDEKSRPVTAVKRVTKDVTPPIQDPALQIILTRPPLYHFEGYESQNLDGTYYHNDPIHIRHEPSWKWKDERSSHIGFTTERLHDILPVADRFDCTGLCNRTVGLPAQWLNNTIQYGNGDGMTIYNGTADFGFGTYDFGFNMTAWNIGRHAADGADMIQAQLVPYDPEYELVYSYPVLQDAQEYAFDDRRGVAMRYGGSWQDETLHPQRRSFINGWNATGTAHDPFAYHVIYKSHEFSAGRNASPGHISMEHTAGSATAMFVRAGHGTILFEWPVSDIVLVDGAARYENVTSVIDAYSIGLAGGDTHLYHTILRYPEMPFAKNFTVRSIDQQGVLQPDRINLRVEPYISLGAEYISGYVYDKVNHDTGDAVIAQTILDDLHPMSQEWSGVGEINGTILRTSVHFGELAPQSVQVAPLDDRLEDLFLLAERPEELRLAAPLDLGLSTIPPTSLIISVNGQEYRLDYKYYAFGGSETITVNTRDDNTAGVKRIPGMIIVPQPENFGTIQEVYVNGTQWRGACSAGCILPFQPDTALNITVENLWGGSAHGMVPAAEKSYPPQASEPRWYLVAAAIVVPAAIWIAVRKWHSS